MKKVKVKVQYFDMVEGNMFFPLEEWIRKEKDNIDNKEIIVFNKNDKVIIENMDSSINNIWAFRIQKLREDGYPKKIKAHETSRDIEMDEDEYLGEDTTFLYDSLRKKLMMQINRFSILPTKFEALLNHSFLGQRNIYLQPISNENVKEMLKSPVRKLKFSISVPKSKANISLSDQISGITDEFDDYMPNTIKIELNMGHERNTFLAKEKTQKLISVLQENYGTVISAEASVLNEYENDIKILPIDLFNTIAYDYIQFNLEEKSKSVGFEFMRDEMYHRFSVRVL